jgi:DivIVA domain-containing protein
MTQTLQERRSVAAEQVDTMLATLSESKVQKITELFDKTVIQEHLDDTNLTEEWEAYHDWLAIRTGAAFPQLSTPGHGKRKTLSNEDTVSEDSKVGADLEDESKSANESESFTNVEVVESEIVEAPVDSTDAHVEQELDEEVDEPVALTEIKESESFFSADDHIDLEDDDYVMPSIVEPDTNRISVTDVLQKEFTIEKLRGGYSENDVDDFLDEIAAFLNEPHSNAELDEKIASVEGQGFHRKKLGSGCNINEVDAYLDAIVVELKARKK